MNYNFFSTLINKTVPFLFKEKLLHLQLSQHTLATAPCGWRVPRWGPVLVFPPSPRCWVLKYEYICVMPSFPGFDWAQQGVSSRFFSWEMQGDSWWSLGQELWVVLRSLPQTALLGSLATLICSGSCCIFFLQTFPLIQPSLACFFFMPVAPSPGTPEVYNSMWESSVERCELVINETNSDISLPECVVCVCTHEFQT